MLYSFGAVAQLSEANSRQPADSQQPTANSPHPTPNSPQPTANAPPQLSANSQGRLSLESITIPPSRVAPYTIIKIKTRSSCAIEVRNSSFQALCDTPMARITWCVSSLAILVIFAHTAAVVTRAPPSSFAVVCLYASYLNPFFVTPKLKSSIYLVRSVSP